MNIDIKIFSKIFESQIEQQIIKEQFHFRLKKKDHKTSYTMTGFIPWN
jgi:hypothetical protein